MKKETRSTITALICFVLMIFLFTFMLLAQMVKAHAEEVNYMELMQAAVMSGDNGAGVSAEAYRTQKIMQNNLTYKIITYEDLSYLSKIIYAEAGSIWLSDEWKMSVGEVVLNRVNSVEFPNTIREVIEQSGQYYGSDSVYFKNLKPDLRCIKIALRLLNGERVFDDGAVVFQANFPQGSGTACTFIDKYLGKTYFCYSSHPELYEEK